MRECRCCPSPPANAATAVIESRQRSDSRTCQRRRAARDHRHVCQSAHRASRGPARCLRSDGRLTRPGSRRAARGCRTARQGRRPRTRPCGLAQGLSAPPDDVSETSAGAGATVRARGPRYPQLRRIYQSTPTLTGAPGWRKNGVSTTTRGMCRSWTMSPSRPNAEWTRYGWTVKIERHSSPADL